MFTYVLYHFPICKQTENLTLDEYVTKLRQLSKNCEFANGEHDILQQVIQNCKSKRLRRRALREPDKKLPDILSLDRTLELNKTSKHHRGSSNQGKTECRNCGGSYPHENGKTCPAKGKSCLNCHKQNHFAKMCRKKKSEQNYVNEMDELSQGACGGPSESSDE